MGLFSGNKDRVEVSVSVSRVVEDRMLPDTTRVSASKAIIQDLGLPESLVDGWMGSLAYRADRMYAYASTRHAYGLPKSSLYTASSGEAVLAQVLAQKHGSPAQVQYHHLAPLNVLHHAWQVLVGEQDYDSRTNRLGVLSNQLGSDAYLTDLIPVYCTQTIESSAPGALDQWGMPAVARYSPLRPNILDSLVEHTPYEVDLSAPVDKVLALYVTQFQVTEGEVTQTWAVHGTLEISLEGANRTPEYYQVMYTLPQLSGTREYYWRYALGSNELVELEAIQEDVFDSLGTYYPFIYFRHDFVDQMGPNFRYTNAYHDQARMMKYLGMDYGDVGAAVNSNPGIENIVHALFMFGVPAGSKDPVDCKYLYEYFNALFFASGAGNSAFQAPRASISGNRVSIHDKRFSMSFAYRALHKSTRGGKVTDVGSYTSSLSNGIYYYRFQRNATLYDEIQVDGLLINYKVYDGHSFGGGAGSGTLLIPLDQALMGRFSPKEREVLYARSMHYVMCSYVEIEVKWYETSFFKVFITIVAIVIAVFSGGALSGVSAAIAAGSATAVAWAIATLIVETIVTTLIAQAAFSMAAKALGAEAAMLLAAVLMVYGVSANIASVQGAQATWANNLLQAGNGLMDAAGKQMQQEILTLQNETTEFNLMADAKWAELEEAQKLLGPVNVLDPFAFIGQEPKTVFGETPSDFYLRTVHAGNIGTLGVDAISSFVPRSLTLPKLQDSLGEDTV